MITQFHSNILNLIFEKLTYPNILISRLICKRFNDVIDLSTFWDIKIQRDFKNHLKIPLVLKKKQYQYLQILSQNDCERGSERFKSWFRCLKFAIKKRDVSLIDYFYHFNRPCIIENQSKRLSLNYSIVYGHPTYHHDFGRILIWCAKYGTVELLEYFFGNPEISKDRSKIYTYTKEDFISTLMEETVIGKNKEIIDYLTTVYQKKEIYRMNLILGMIRGAIKNNDLETFISAFNKCDHVNEPKLYDHIKFNIHDLIRYGRHEMLDFLRNLPDCNDKINEVLNRDTPNETEFSIGNKLYYAIKGNDITKINDILSNDKNITDYIISSAVGVAASGNNRELFYKFLDYAKMRNLCINKGPNHNGRAAIICSLIRGSFIDIPYKLIEDGHLFATKIGENDPNLFNGVTASNYIQETEPMAIFSCALWKGHNDFATYILLKYKHLFPEYYHRYGDIYKENQGNMYPIYIDVGNSTFIKTKMDKTMHKYGFSRIWLEEFPSEQISMGKSITEIIKTGDFTYSQDAREKLIECYNLDRISYGKQTWTELINAITDRNNFINKILWTGITEMDIIMVCSIRKTILTKWINKQYENIDIDTTESGRTELINKILIERKLPDGSFTSMNKDDIIEWVNRIQTLGENQCIGMALLCTEELRNTLWPNMVDNDMEIKLKKNYIPMRPFYYYSIPKHLISPALGYVRRGKSGATPHEDHWKLPEVIEDHGKWLKKTEEEKENIRREMSPKIRNLYFKDF